MGKGDMVQVETEHELLGCEFARDNPTVERETRDPTILDKTDETIITGPDEMDGSPEPEGTNTKVDKELIRLS